MLLVSEKTRVLFVAIGAEDILLGVFGVWGVVTVWWLMNGVVYQTSLEGEASKGGNWMDSTTLGQEIIFLRLWYTALWQVKAVKYFGRISRVNWMRIGATAHYVMSPFIMDRKHPSSEFAISGPPPFYRYWFCTILFRITHQRGDEIW